MFFLSRCRRRGGRGRCSQIKSKSVRPSVHFALLSSFLPTSHPQRETANHSTVTHSQHLDMRVNCELYQIDVQRVLFLDLLVLEFFIDLLKGLERLVLACLCLIKPILHLFTYVSSLSTRLRRFYILFLLCYRVEL